MDKRMNWQKDKERRILGSSRGRKTPTITNQPDFQLGKEPEVFGAGGSRRGCGKELGLLSCEYGDKVCSLLKSKLFFLWCSQIA